MANKNTNKKKVVVKKAAVAMESINNYSRCKNGNTSNRDFTPEHAAEVKARFFNGGVSRSAVLEIVNAWNSVAKTTRYWV